MTSPVRDKRDGYRAAVDLSVTEFGMDRKWTDAQILKAKRVCYRVIWTESDWRNLYNVRVPESALVLPNDGPGKDLDSTGLYQQRASQGWGTVIGSMDPYTATVRFLTVMIRDVSDWATAEESAVCQRVQRSQYNGTSIDPKTGNPYPFAANYLARQNQTDALTVDPLYFTHRGI